MKLLRNKKLLWVIGTILIVILLIIISITIGNNGSNSKEDIKGEEPISDGGGTR